MQRFISLAAGLFLSVFATTATASTFCVSPENVNQLATEIAARVNANRRAHGQPPLRFTRRLAQAPLMHAFDMLIHHFFDLRRSDGSNSQRRVRNAGYEDCIVAENIAWGYPQSQQIINGWMNSAGHRRNMMHPRIEEFGVGITQGPKGPYWVLVVGKQC